MHNGVPFDVAFEMEEETRIAFCIVFSMFRGRKFDWDAMEFERIPGDDD